MLLDLYRYILLSAWGTRSLGGFGGLAISVGASSSSSSRFGVGRRGERGNRALSRRSARYSSCWSCCGDRGSSGARLPFAVGALPFELRRHARSNVRAVASFCCSLSHSRVEMRTLLLQGSAREMGKADCAKIYFALVRPLTADPCSVTVSATEWGPCLNPNLELKPSSRKSAKVTTYATLPSRSTNDLAMTSCCCLQCSAQESPS